MDKIRAPLNRTLTLSPDETAALSSLCLRADSKLGAEGVIDKIICGDTFQTAALLPDRRYDLLILDPPYNLTKKFGASAFREMNISDYGDYFELLLSLLLPKLKTDASVYVCADWRTSIVVGSVLEKRLTLRNRITWQREKGRGALGNWKNAMEDIWFATVGRDYYFNPDAVKIRRRVLAPYKSNGSPKDWETVDGNKFRNTGASNFWDDITIPYWSMPENTDHPTQKPEKLIAKLLLASSKPCDLVLDPFLGSGTSVAVCRKLGRSFTGIEIDPDYCAIAQRRLQLAEQDKSIQGYADGVFWERNTNAYQPNSGRKKKD